MEALVNMPADSFVPVEKLSVPVEYQEHCDFIILIFSYLVWLRSILSGIKKSVPCLLGCSSLALFCCVCSLMDISPFQC